MSTRDFTTTFSVDQTPKEAFDAINDVGGWWAEHIAGSADTLGDECDDICLTHEKQAAHH